MSSGTTAARVALVARDIVRQRLMREIPAHDGGTVQVFARLDDMYAIMESGLIDIAVVESPDVVLTAELIERFDSTGIRLVVLTDREEQRRQALSLDFREICRSDAPWVDVIEILQPPHITSSGLPDMAFFDIVASSEPPGTLPEVFRTPVADFAQGSVTVPDFRQASDFGQESVAGPFSASDFVESPAAPSQASSERESCVIAVWGPAGAPGRTTVAVNVAAELVIRGSSVLLIDADPYGGAIAPRLGLLDETPGFAAACRLADHGLLTRYELERLSQEAEVGGGSLPVLTGIVRPDRWPELSASRVAGVLETSREFFDVIVVDVGFNLESDEEISSDLFSPRRNASSLSALGVADVIVMVADSDVVGLSRFLRASADLRFLFPETRLVTVANRVRSRIVGLAPRAQVRQTLERFGGLSDISMLVHDDRSLDACALRASALCDVAPKSELRKAMAAVALRCVPAGVTPVGKKKLIREGSSRGPTGSLG